ncbi:hypothetical protein [Leifsonia sp. 1010]|uniref:hypothetical protein n=1 Tax=Leifsonia sp. 1010 TaxID=2817769 RepID=UPI002855A979|nr:hypothetical protein [Leifsonia sp. 1010]MDR6611926.1 MFS family permease [Leifsonia sp. 1010]
MTDRSGTRDAAAEKNEASVQRFVRSAGAPFRAALTSRRGRWWLLASVTAAGWVALAFWMASGDTDDEALWAMLLICGLVGVGQLLALLPLGTDAPRPRAGRGGRAGTARRAGTVARPRKRTSGTWLLRWWQVVALAAAHILVVTALAFTLVQSAEYDDDRLGTVVLVLFIGTLGWFLVPLVLFVVLIVILLVVGLIVAGVSLIASARRDPGDPSLTRARAVSRGTAMIGGGVALACLIAAIPFVSSGHSVGSYKGAAVAAAIVLLLQAVGIVPSPDAWWYAILRYGYLVGLVAVLQYASFRLWGPHVWRQGEREPADESS